MRYKDEHRKDVVCAILSCREGNEDQFLIGRQSGTLYYVLDGLYEFPGGEVNHGESLESALKREVKGFFMHPFTFDFTEEEDGIEGCIKFYPMFCTLRADSPDPSARDGVHDSLSWVTADSLGLFDMLRADIPIVRMSNDDRQNQRR